MTEMTIDTRECRFHSARWHSYDQPAAFQRQVALLLARLPGRNFAPIAICWILGCGTGIFLPGFWLSSYQSGWLVRSGEGMLRFCPGRRLPGAFLVGADAEAVAAAAGSQDLIFFPARTAVVPDLARLCGGCTGGFSHWRCLALSTWFGVR